MWVLLLVMLTVTGEVKSEHVLNTFPLARQCQVEGSRILEEMAKAYPGDTDYQIVCKYRAQRAVANEPKGF